MEEERRTSMERKRGKAVGSMPASGPGSGVAGGGKYLSSSKRDGVVSLQAGCKSNERWRLKLVDRHRVFLKSHSAERYLSAIANVPSPPGPGLLSSSAAPAQPPQSAADGAGGVEAFSASAPLGSAVMMTMSQAAASALASTSHLPNHVYNTFFIRPKKRRGGNNSHHHPGSGNGGTNRERDKASADREAEGGGGDDNKIFIHAYDGRFVVVKDVGSGVIALSEDSLGQAWKYTAIVDEQTKDPNAGTPFIRVVCVRWCVCVRVCGGVCG
jgi:hypothetical protein